MKLNELLTYVESHPKTLFIESTGDVDTDVIIYRRLVFVKAENVADSMAVCILIKNKGLENEAAYFKGDMPFYMKTTPFTDALKAKIAEVQTQLPALEAYNITAISEADEIAEVTAYIYNDTNKVSTATKYVAAMVNGTIKFRKLA